MKWRRKSLIQRVCAALPIGSEKAYYALQRRFGRMRLKPDPSVLIAEAARLTLRLREVGFSVKGARVMEVGTGWGVDMPLGMFLCGASAVKTFDLHRYLKPERVVGAIDAIRKNREQIRRSVLPAAEEKELDQRLDALCAAGSFEGILRAAGIEYFAPADAARTGLPDHSVDLQISYTVFEHIPEPVLRAILLEANRVLTEGGIALHHIDPSDHFSHDDASISAVNFLQFSDAEWRRSGGNQFAYHNRMRVDEYRRMFEECGHRILQWEPHIDQRSLKAIRNGFPLHSKYVGKPEEILATTVIHSVTSPNAPRL